MYDYLFTFNNNLNTTSQQILYVNIKSLHANFNKLIRCVVIYIKENINENTNTVDINRLKIVHIKIATLKSEHF